MFLKSLSIKGFKSFVDRTTLEFEPGLAVVVGPNGSGKSNVVDAVAWVLGAQGARSLRGGKMDDVIFAGTPRRPPASRAEVSITLDNSSGVLPFHGPSVKITRSLTRDGESGYAINDDACRLLDVIELLSDAGVGRTQHVIVGQGRLDHILTARPEDRRSVIEEAAGILKFRQRKEKAQRRLAATDVNLDRLADLVKEVKRHLRPLERQADAARRHDGLVAELRAVRLHLAGRELRNLDQRLEGLAQRRATLTAAEREARQQAAGLGELVAEAEAALASLPVDELGDAFARAESLLARTEGLAALVSEKQRGAERSLLALADSGVVETLTTEAAQLRADLEAVGTEEAELEPEAEALAAAADDLAARRAGLVALSPDVPGADGRRAQRLAGEARAELAGLGHALARTEAEQSRLEDRRQAVVARLGRLQAEVAGGGTGTEPDESALVEAAESARRAREEAEEETAAAEGARRAADGEAHRWAARVEALAAALGELRDQVTGSGRFEGLEGLAGVLVDVVRIEDGAEAAVAAGLGDVLRGIVAAGDGAAREAIRRLVAAEADGLVLIADGEGAAAEAGTTVPPGARLLAGCVASDVPGLMPTLTRLLQGMVLFDGTWEEAAELARRHSDLVVITPRGERFDGRGAWRSGGRGAGATQAAVEEATARAAEAAEARAAAEEALEAARTKLEEARRWESAGERALESHRARHAALAAAAERAGAELSAARDEQQAVEAQAEALAAQYAAEVARRDELAEQLPRLEEAATAERDNEFQRRQRVEEVAREEASVAAARRDLDRRIATVAERRGGLERRLAEVEARLLRHGEARAAAEERRAALDLRLRGYRAILSVLEERLEAVRAIHERLRTQRRARSEAAREAGERLEGLRRDLASAERAASEAREQRARVEVEEAEVRTRLATTTEALRRDLECEPEVAYAAPEPPVPEGTTLVARATELERDLRKMGPINPLALEEYAACKERHEMLESQVEDVRSARRELTTVIRSVDEEIVNRFATAYADTEGHFSRLIETLFPGGSGRLRLTEPDDLLNTGIEIEARPSGKNVRRLSLLSGGERSLTAFAFLFAVFRALPSPFYLLDEVEAALDDVNLCRFIELIQTFRDEAQLLVVSHQKRTMEAADSLYGVSMAPGGSSVVVTQRVPSSVTVGSH